MAPQPRRRGSQVRREYPRSDRVNIPHGTGVLSSAGFSYITGPTRCRLRAQAHLALHERQDVAVGVLEPGGGQVVHHVDDAVTLGTGQVVLLERHSLPLERGDLGTEIG